MTTFEWLLRIAGACGALMVVGSMLLLYKGIITLTSISKSPALQAELKDLKIKTYSPALGLFVIGLFFVIAALQFSKSAPMRVTGKINLPRAADVRIIISSERWSIEPGMGGGINSVIYPNFEILRVEYVVPGYGILHDNAQAGQVLTIALDKAALVGQNQTESPLEKQENIDHVVALPPVSAEGTLGGR